MTLTKTQTLYIDNDLKSKGLSDGFRFELLDHICCMTENKMTQGKPFAQAYAESLAVFGNKGFEELKAIKISKWRLLPNRVATAGIAACFLLTVMVVNATDHPDIAPLGSDCHISSHFGERFNPKSKKVHFHKGIDFKVESGSPVRSTASGVIKKSVDSEDGYGKHIVITHEDGFETKYAHLSELRVTEGQKVAKGAIIGLSGSSGQSIFPHLHYEVSKNGEKVDPALYLTKRDQTK